MLRCLRKRSLDASLLKRFQSTTAQFYAFPELQNLTKFQETGIPGLFSQQGLQTAYNDRLQTHLSKLNQELEGTSIDARNSLDVLVSETSQSPKDRKVFTHASLINNICFALSSIGSVREENPSIIKPSIASLLQSPDVSNEITNVPTPEVLKRIESNFGSLIEFKTLLLNSANAINGDGFTWVVARGLNHTDSPNADDITYDSLYVVNTYNAGSPTNPKKNNNNGENHIYEKTIVSIEEAKNIVNSNFNDKAAYKPILAIDASPKNWLHDYGVYGKRQYLEQVWKAIDWDVVKLRLPDFKQKSV